MTMICTCVVFATLVVMVTGSGTLLDPPSRGVMWKEGFKTETNFNFMQLNCGGVKQQEIGPRQCGVCGDPADGRRRHELGNKYGTGTIGRYYEAGIREMEIKVELLAYEKGFFEFRICPANEKPVTQECLNQNLLPIKEGYLAGMPMRFYPDKAGEFRLTIAIPPNMTCDRCVLQWRYRTANSWGVDPSTKEEGIGLGQQEEFFNCADIRIGGNVPQSVLKNPYLASKTSGTQASNTNILVAGGSIVDSTADASLGQGVDTRTDVASRGSVSSDTTVSRGPDLRATRTMVASETGISSGGMNNLPGDGILLDTTASQGTGIETTRTEFVGETGISNTHVTGDRVLMDMLSTQGVADLAATGTDFVGGTAMVDTGVNMLMGERMSLDTALSQGGEFGTIGAESSSGAVIGSTGANMLTGERMSLDTVRSQGTVSGTRGTEFISGTLDTTLNQGIDFGTRTTDSLNGPVTGETGINVPASERIPLESVNQGTDFGTSRTDFVGGTGISNAGINILTGEQVLLDATASQGAEFGTAGTAFVGESGIGLQDAASGVNVMSGRSTSQTIDRFTDPATGSFDNANIVMTDLSSQVSSPSDSLATIGQDQSVMTGAQSENNVIVGIQQTSSRTDSVGQGSITAGGELLGNSGSALFDNQFWSTQGSFTTLGDNQGVINEGTQSFVYNDGGTNTQMMFSGSGFTDQSGRQSVIDSGIAADTIQSNNLGKSSSILLGDTSSGKSSSSSADTGSAFFQDIFAGTLDTAVHNINDTASMTGAKDSSQDKKASFIYIESNSGGGLNSGKPVATDVVSNGQIIVDTSARAESFGTGNTQSDQSITFSQSNFEAVGGGMVDTTAGAGKSGFDKSSSVSLTDTVQIFPEQITVDKTTTNTIKEGTPPGIKTKESTGLLLNEGTSRGLVSGGEVQMAKTFIGMSEFHGNTLNSGTSVISGKRENAFVPSTTVIDKAVMDSSSTTGQSLSGSVSNLSTKQLNPSAINNFIMKSPGPTDASVFETTRGNSLLSGTTSEIIVFKDMPKPSLMSTNISPTVMTQTSTNTANTVPASSFQISGSAGVPNNQEVLNSQHISSSSSVDSNIGQWAENQPQVDPVYFDTINTDPSLLPSPITGTLNEVQLKAVRKATGGTLQPAIVVSDSSLQQNVVLSSVPSLKDSISQGKLIQTDINMQTGTAKLPDAKMSKIINLSGVTTQLMRSDGKIEHATADMSPVGTKAFMPFEIIDPSAQVTSIKGFKAPGPTESAPILNAEPTASLEVNMVAPLDKTATVVGAFVPTTKKKVSTGTVSSKAVGLKTLTLTDVADPVDQTTMSDPFQHLPAQSLAVIPLEPGAKQIKANILGLKEVASGNILDNTIKSSDKLIGRDSVIDVSRVEQNTINIKPQDGLGLPSVLNDPSPIAEVSMESAVSKSIVKETKSNKIPNSKSGLSTDVVVDLRDVKITAGIPDKGSVDTSTDLMSGKMKNGHVVQELKSVSTRNIPVVSDISASSGSKQSTDSSRQAQRGGITAVSSSDFSPGFRFMRDPRTGMMIRVPVGIERLATREQDQIRLNSIREAIERRRIMSESGRTDMDTLRRISTPRGGSFPPEYMVEGAGMTGSSSVRFGNIRARSSSSLGGRDEFSGSSGLSSNPFSPFGDPSARRPIFPFGMERGTATRRVLGTRSRGGTRAGRTDGRPGSVTIVTAPSRPGRSGDVSAREDRDRRSRITRTSSRAEVPRSGSSGARTAVRSGGRSVSGPGQSDRRRFSRFRGGDFGSAATVGAPSGMDGRGSVSRARRVMDMGGVPIVGGRPAMMGGASGLGVGDMRFSGLPFGGRGSFDMEGVFRPEMDPGFFPMGPFVPFRTGGSMSFPMTPML